MENKQNRDALLQEILRETASHKRPSEEIREEQAKPQPHAAAPEHQTNLLSRQTTTEPEPPVFPNTVQPDETLYSEPEESAQHTAQWEQPHPTEHITEAEEVPSHIDHVPLSQTGHFHVDNDLEGDSQTATLPSEEAHPTRTSHTGKRRKKHRILSALVMTFVIIAVSIILSVVLIIYGRDLLGINSDSSTKIVTIPNGATLEEIAEILKEENIISQPNFFVMIAGMSNKDTNIRPGDHELRPDMAYETILSELTSDPLDEEFSVTLTFPEGIRLVDAADLLEENNVCDADEFLDYFNNDATSFGYAYEEYLPSFQDEKFYKMEGYLFPDTYTFYQEMSVELVAEKILSNFNSKIDPAYYDRMQVLGLNLDETITLASMIQAEAGTTEQMADISSVFWNRLNNATEYPLLQSDPTTNYVEEVIKPHSETYNQALYDAYDTYTSPGLPPGPICNPGSDAIYAALYPNNTNYYYFYANLDTGETYFARTLEEHDANQAMVASMQASASEAEQKNGEDGEEGENTAQE